jgi:hypothetical protein
VSIRHSIVLGFASCGVYTVGGGLQHVRALESLRAFDSHGRSDSGAGRLSASPRLGRTCRAAVTTGAVVCAVATVVFASDGHLHRWPSLRHMGMVLTHEVLRFAARDPFLAGSGLCVLAVVAFVVAVAAMTTCVDDAGPAYPRILIGGLADRVHIGGRPRAAGQRPRGARRRSGTRRPPTMQATRPGNRPVALSPVLGRTTR